MHFWADSGHSCRSQNVGGWCSNPSLLRGGEFSCGFLSVSSSICCPVSAPGEFIPLYQIPVFSSWKPWASLEVSSMSGNFVLIHFVMSLCLCARASCWDLTQSKVTLHTHAPLIFNLAVTVDALRKKKHAENHFHFQINSSSASPEWGALIELHGNTCSA